MPIPFFFYFIFFFRLFTLFAGKAQKYKDFEIATCDCVVEVMERVAAMIIFV